MWAQANGTMFKTSAVDQLIPTAKTVKQVNYGTQFKTYAATPVIWSVTNALALINGTSIIVSAAMKII